MHSRMLGLLVVAAVPLISCGGESGGVTARQSALKSTSNGQEKWVQSEAVNGPGDFVFPMDCVNGEMFQYVGTVTFVDHCVPVPGGVHDNWHIFYDPEEFTSLDTGQKWVFLPGASNSGVQLLEGPGCPTSPFLTWDQVAHLPLRNTTTGQKIQFRLNVHVAINAAGEIKRDFFNFGCTHGP
jgi:hypothetical protein